MHATLCRLLSRAPSTAYYRQNVQSLPFLLGKDRGSLEEDASVRAIQEWLIEQALEAYTLDKMHPLIQGFLKDCDRCWQIEDEIIIENPTMRIEEIHKRSIAILDKEQEVPIDG